MEVSMNSISIRGAEAFATPMASLQGAADNEAAERMPDNEAAEIAALSPSTKAPLRSGEGSLLDIQA
jgi:hypothetical protein